jgi:hypothetical protein
LAQEGKESLVNVYLDYRSIRGYHDECHRWIENNRDLTVEQIKERCTSVPLRCDRANVAVGAGKDEWPASQEGKDALPVLTEKDLQTIFCGLIESVAASSACKRQWPRAGRQVLFKDEGNPSRRIE